MMKPLLIDERKEQADAAIQNEQAKAAKLNEAIRFYNSQPNLLELTKDRFLPS